MEPEELKDPPAGGSYLGSLASAVAGYFRRDKGPDDHQGGEEPEVSCECTQSHSDPYYLNPTHTLQCTHLAKK